MLREVLPKHGLWFMQMPTRTNDKSTLTTRVFHTSGEWIEDSIEMPDTELKGGNNTQKVGASITYFRRYALSSIFGVASDEDVDGNIQQNQKVVQQQQPAQQRQQPTKPQPVQKKQDPREFVTNNWNTRINAGETPESILKDYADLLKTDVRKEVIDMNDNEVKSLAISLYTRK
jgi:hypothetical protein